MMDPLTQIWNDAGQVAVAIGGVIALLNCFFGYRLLRVWTALLGFLLGWAITFAIAASLGAQPGVAALIGVVGGLALGFLAYYIYKAGVFIFCFMMGLSTCLGLITVSWLGWTVGVLVGIGVGILAMIYMRQVIIFASAIAGGINAANCLLPLFGVTAAPVFWVVGLVLVFLGCLVQLRTTHSRKEETHNA